jgi:hypothetical protein
MRYRRSRPLTGALTPGVEAAGSGVDRTAIGTHVRARELVHPAIVHCPHCHRLPTIAPAYGFLEPYGWVHVCPRLERRVDSSRVQYLTYGEAVRGWNAWCDTQSQQEPAETPRR